MNGRAMERAGIDPARAAGAGMLADLLPATVLVETVRGDCTATFPMHPDEACCIAHAVPARRREFSQGRACARSLMRRMGLGECPVGRGRDGAPIWPAGVVGSISHTTGCCSAALAHRHDVAGLGIDVDTLEPLDPDILPLICTPDELRAARLVIDGGKLIFSCKESLYKCYRSLYETFVDPLDVQIAIDADRHEFRATAVAPVDGLADVCERTIGRFGWEDGLVYSTAVLIRG